MSACKILNFYLSVPINTKSHLFPSQGCLSLCIIHKLPDTTPCHVQSQFEKAYQLVLSPVTNISRTLPLFILSLQHLLPHQFERAYQLVLSPVTNIFRILPLFILSPSDTYFLLHYPVTFTLVYVLELFVAPVL